MTNIGIGINKRLKRLGNPTAGIVAIIDSLPMDFEISPRIIKITPGYTRIHREYRLYTLNKK